MFKGMKKCWMKIPIANSCYLQASKTLLKTLRHRGKTRFPFPERNSFIRKSEFIQSLLACLNLNSKNRHLLPVFSPKFTPSIWKLFFHCRNEILCSLQTLHSVENMRLESPPENYRKITIKCSSLW